MEKIDIVIPWVDSTDPQWLKDKNSYLGFVEEPNTDLDKYYRDWNTLLFVFRGIDKFMPWVNKVYFLTYGHIPKWLNIASSKLVILKHSDFFLDKATLPVFNSDAIEMNLLGIDQLSEQFIYFNDDTLVLKPVSPERFFRDGKPVDYLIQDIPRGGFLYKKFRSNDTYADIVLNSVHPLNSFYPKRNLLESNKECFYHPSYHLIDKIRNFIFNCFSNYDWIKVNHSPQPILKSSINECYKLFPDILKETSYSKFRRYSDVCHYIYRNLSLVKGDFYPYNFYDSFCLVLSSYKRFEKELPIVDCVTFLCANDSEKLSKSDFIKIKPLLEEKLLSILPEKSSFEK